MSIWSRLKRAPIAEADQFVSPETSTEEAGPQRYLPGTIVRYPVGGDSHLLYSLNTGSAQIVPSYQAELLDHCRGLETLEEHARACSDAAGLSPVGGAYHVATVVEELENLADIGLLISESELLETCRERAGQSPEPPPIATVGVVTANRIDMLERCLTSYMENCRAFDRTPKFAVMDDSPSAEIRGATRQLLVELKKRFGFDIAYAGLEEKQRFAKDLVSAGDLPPDVVNFALFAEGHAGFSGGKNRNALLLQTAGEMFLSTDDDAVCRLVVPPEEDEFDITTEGSRGMKWWFFPNRKAALESVSFVDEDALGIHEQLLGKDIGSCVTMLEDIDALNLPQLDPALRSKATDARVLVTTAGIFGDSGTPRPAILQALSADSRERLLELHHEHLAALTSREVLRLVPRHRIGRGAGLNSTTLACDNRELLPPFMPVLRGEDTVFGITLQTCFRNAFVGSVPRAILHAPMETRVFTSNTMQESSAGVWPSGVMLACISSREFWPWMGDGISRLRSLGEHLMTLGLLPLPEFEKVVRAGVCRTISHHLQFVDEQLKDPKLSKGWAEEGQAYVENLRANLINPDYIVPGDLRNGRVADEARKLSQKIVCQFGQLLDIWPHMLDTAKELRSRDKSPAVPL